MRFGGQGDMDTPLNLSQSVFISFIRFCIPLKNPSIKFTQQLKTYLLRIGLLEGTFARIELP